MRVCLISKYPPIEGGVSARTYWLAKALGERGHGVHLVTNALEVENEYRERIDPSDPEFIPHNVYLHSTEADTNPWHIPFSNAYAERLANLAIEVIERHDLQIIDSYYILPYAIAGFIAKNVTGRPLIVRHAGSDLGKLFAADAYRTLFKAVLQRADKIITVPQLKEMFLALGIKEAALAYDDRVSVDTKAFHPEVAPFPLAAHLGAELPTCPIITYIGKINYYWQTKGFGELIAAARTIKADFRLLFVANGRGLNEFKTLVKESGLENKSIFIGFVPPWQVPSLIKLSTCVVMPEREFPILNHMPILPREVMAVGRCPVISRELFAKKCYGGLIDGENVLVVEPKDIGQFAAMLEKIIQDPEKALKIGEKAYQYSVRSEDFNEYIEFTLECYGALLK